MFDVTRSNLQGSTHCRACPANDSAVCLDILVSHRLQDLLRTGFCLYRSSFGRGDILTLCTHHKSIFGVTLQTGYDIRNLITGDTLDGLYRCTCHRDIIGGFILIHLRVLIYTVVHLNGVRVGTSHRSPAQSHIDLIDHARLQLDGRKESVIFQRSNFVVLVRAGSRQGHARRCQSQQKKIFIEFHVTFLLISSTNRCSTSCYCCR